MNPTRGTGILIEPVAVIRSPFEEKFGIPRQPGLVPRAHGEVRLLEPYRDPVMLRGLEGFSHVWLTVRFDRCVTQGWRPTVRPPRLGGNAEVGVWASRSPFRPNFLGLSVVRLLEVVPGPDPLLHVAGIDLLEEVLEAGALARQQHRLTHPRLRVRPSFAKQLQLAPAAHQIAQPASDTGLETARILLEVFNTPDTHRFVEALDLL